MYTMIRPTKFQRFLAHRTILIDLMTYYIRRLIRKIAADSNYIIILLILRNLRKQYRVSMMLNY